jgi:hypothetical protein
MQQSAEPAWQLSEGRALRLAAESRARWLRVTQGRLWLTHSAQGPEELPLDCWLDAGDAVELPAGQDAVVEAWPCARFELLEGAPAEAVSASIALKPSAALRQWLQGWKSPSPASAASSPCAS